jgi:hypothetical protein
MEPRTHDNTTPNNDIIKDNVHIITLKAVLVYKMFVHTQAFIYLTNLSVKAEP